MSKGFKCPDQLIRFTRAKARRWLKRRTNKLERRAAKHNPETAPKKHRYCGYD